jgi:hypothetical protein
VQLVAAGERQGEQAGNVDQDGHHVEAQQREEPARSAVI